MRRLISLILAALLLGGCGIFPEEPDETRDWSAQKLYEKARAAVRSGNYETAIDYFEKLEARYPFGRYAQQALLESAYAYYKFDEPDSAIATLDRFIKLYPSHPHLDYAYYLKGLANFNRGRDIIDKIIPRDPSERDPGAARQSFYDFEQVVKKFPNSRYAEDARLRMAYLRNNLAAYEVHVADYYMRRGAFVAAANRAQYVVQHYDGTPAVPDALELLVRAYRELELEDLARDALRVLEHNFPERARELRNS